MTNQRTFDASAEILRPPAAGNDGINGNERLRQTRVELEDVFAAADAILDGIRTKDSQRFLEEVRQRGGE